MNNVICYGEALIDFTQEGNSFIPHPGGSPYNVAIALGRLGSSVGFCSQLSLDLFGKQLLQYLTDNQVSVENIVLSSAPSTLAFVSTPEHSEPEYAFYSNGAADVLISEDSKIPSPHAAIHHFGSISLMQEPCGTFWTKYLMQLQGFISFDPNIRASLIPDPKAYLNRFHKIVNHIDLLRLSLVDLKWLAPTMSKEEFAKEMIASGVKIVAITAGDDGAWVYTENYSLHHPAFDIHVEDTIGAGDTFTAGFLSVLEKKISRNISSDKKILTEALRVGCVAAALNCKNKGANPPTKVEIEKELID